MNLFLLGAGLGAHAQLATRAVREALGVLPFFDPSSVQGWETDGVCAAWACHPRDRVGRVRYVHPEPQDLALFAGRPVRWSLDGSTCDGRGPLDPGSYLDDDGWAAGLDGRFVAARAGEGEGLEVATDALGAYPVYVRDINGTAWVSNSPEILRHVAPSRLTPDLDVLASTVGGGWSVLGHPWWQEIRRLDPGYVHRWGGDGTIHAESGGGGAPTPTMVDAYRRAEWDVGEAADLLTAMIGALADWPDRPSVVPVTGGRDSRVVLAAALHAGIEFTSVTGGAPGDPDVVAGAALCAAAGIPHALLERDPHGERHGELELAARIVGAGAAGTATLADAAGFALGPRDGPLVLWHSGQGGEVARAYYGGGGVPLRAGVEHHLRRRFEGRRAGRPGLLDATGRDRLARQVFTAFDDLADRGVRASDVPDAFYLARRMGTWAGPTHSAVEWVRDTTSPLWSRHLLPLLLAAPRAERHRDEVHRKLIERLAPQLLDVPFSGGEGWIGEESALARRTTTPRRRVRQARAGLARRLPAGRGATAAQATPGQSHPPVAAPAAVDADPFVAVLATLRGWIEEPHAVWAVVDRDRARGLAAREPAALDEMNRAYLWRLATVLGGMAGPGSVHEPELSVPSQG